jgi:5-methylthioadenosine/S-adenosylhomocysteine deaminase
VTARLFRPDVLLDDTGAREDHALLVADGRIAAVGPADLLAAQHPDAETVGLADRALLPGTVNAHSHSFQSLLRGTAEDGPYDAWLATLYRYAPAMSVEAAYAGALFAFGEMLLRGVTTVVDFFYLHHGSNERALAVAAAAREVGIRLVLARSMYVRPEEPRRHGADRAATCTISRAACAGRARRAARRRAD